MSFEFTGLQYDGTRKVTTTQTFKSQSVGIATAIRKTYMPVPYNMSFELSIFTKLNDDMLQIVEQITPYFQPAYTLSVNLVDTIGEKRDIPIVIENVTMQDDYEGNYSTRRSLLHNKIYCQDISVWPVGDTAKASRDLIKKVRVGYVQDDTSTQPEILLILLFKSDTELYRQCCNKSCRRRWNDY